MNLEKHRLKLIAARDEMNRTIAAIDTVLAYVSVGGKRTGHRLLGRSPKNAVKKGDEKTGVKKSTLTKPLRMKPRKKRKMSPEGEAKRLAGYRAYQERRKAELAKLHKVRAAA